MMLPLLLAISVPQTVDDYPEDPSPCSVTWGSEVGARFTQSAEPRVDRRCRELVSALAYEAAAGDVRVRIDGESLAFTVTVTLMDGESVLVEESDGQVCECGGNDLAAFAAQRVARAIEKQREPEEVPTPAESLLGEESTGGGSEHPPPPPVLPQRHVLRWVGAGLTLVGLATVITGAIIRPMTRTEPVFDDGGWGERSKARFSPVVTGVTIGAGAAVMGAGVALIVVDSVRSKKSRAVSLSPSVTPSFAGFSLQSRF